MKDRFLLDLPVGCDLRLEISLPKPSESIRFIGTLRHITKAKDSKEIVYLGIEFSDMLPEDRKS